MFNVTHGKEIALRVKNDMGVLGEVARLVAERGLSIQAVAGSVEEELCTLRLITDDNLRACDVLREHGYQPVEEPVVLLELPHKPGLLRKLTHLLGRAGIEIQYLYATSRPREAHCLLVLHTTNNDRALVALSEVVPETD